MKVIAVPFTAITLSSSLPLNLFYSKSIPLRLYKVYTWQLYTCIPLKDVTLRGVLQKFKKLVLVTGFTKTEITFIAQGTIHVATELQCVSNVNWSAFMEGILIC